MLRRERGQVTAEYAGVLLLVAVIVSALAVSGPARPIADEAARAVCEIAGQCSAGGAATSVDPQAMQRAASDLQGLVARDADPAAVAAFFKGLDPDVAGALAHERPELVGNLDGAPIPLRYAANGEAIDREIARLPADGIGHSYGSLVTGLAESNQGLDVDETVLVGSPGVGVGHASDLGDGNVWVGLAKWDLVGYSEWHGPNPHDRAFGATRFHTGDISGHSSYVNEGSQSLRSIGLITAGYLDEVNVNDGLF